MVSSTVSHGPFWLITANHVIGIKEPNLHTFLIFPHTSSVGLRGARLDQLADSNEPTIKSTVVTLTSIMSSFWGNYFHCLFIFETRYLYHSLVKLLNNVQRLIWNTLSMG